MMTSKGLGEPSGTHFLASEFNRVSMTVDLKLLDKSFAPETWGTAVPAEGTWSPGSDPQAGVLPV